MSGLSRGPKSDVRRPPYGPASTNTGFCGNAFPPLGGVAVPSGAGMSSTGVSSEVRMTVVLPASHFPTSTFVLSAEAADETRNRTPPSDASRNAQAIDVATGREGGRDLDHDGSSSTLTARRSPGAIGNGKRSGVCRHQSKCSVVSRVGHAGRSPFPFLAAGRDRTPACRCKWYSKPLCVAAVMLTVGSSGNVFPTLPSVALITVPAELMQSWVSPGSEVQGGVLVELTT